MAEKKIDLIDSIDASLKQLRAMLSMTYGQTGETFRRENDNLQDEYMWGCHDKVASIIADWQKLEEIRTAEREARA